MKKRANTIYGVSLFILDAILVNIAVLLTFLIRYLGYFPPENFKAYKSMFLFITLFRTSAMYFLGLYENKSENTAIDIVYNTFVAATISSILIVATSFYNRSFAFPRTVIIISWFMNILLLSGYRLLLRLILKKKKLNVLIIGEGKQATSIANELTTVSPLYKLCAFVSVFSESTSKTLCDIKVVPFKDLVETIKLEKIDIAIIASENFEKEFILKTIETLFKTGVRIQILPSLYEISIGKIELIESRGLPLIEITRGGPSPWGAFVKRTIDIFGSIFILTFTSPLLLIIAILVKFSSKGPVFYLQERVGLNGNFFTLIKFRTMYENAEEKGPQKAINNDPRVTKAGRFLRKTRLDELPQFLNVLMGHMSIVGPRPERPVFVEKYVKEIFMYSWRLKMKPGITGLAQIHGKYDIDVEHKLKYDLAYINNWSLLLDIKIMIMTLKVMISFYGAN